MRFLNSVVLAAFVVCSTVYAGAVVDFGFAPAPTGSISYAGGANPLTGSLGVVDVMGVDTPTNDWDSFGCIACTLTFSTGLLSSHTGTEWVFGPGGTISLDGTIDVNGNHTSDPGEPTGVLLSGSFTGNTTVLVLGNTFRLVGGSFNDNLGGPLGLLFGVPAGSEGALNVQFMDSANTQPPNGFRSSRVLSGDVTSTATPEPLTVGLVGMGLLTFAATRRRRS